MRAQLQTRTNVAPAPPFLASVHGGLLQRKCACGQHTIAGGECEECRKKSLTLQRRAVSVAEPAEVPPIVHEVLRSPGQPLDPATRAFFEPRFGHDFSGVQVNSSVPATMQPHLIIGGPSEDLEQEADVMAEGVTHISWLKAGRAYDFSGVRIHADAKAAESARAVNALAYAVGRDLVFGAGQYAPGTMAGNKLLAHELTHVIQQQAARVSGSPAAILQRSEVNYLEQVVGNEAKPYLEKFDRSVEEIDKILTGATGPEADELREAAVHLRALRAAGKVTAWYTSGGLHYASYDNASGELRLHITFSAATFPGTLIHEAIHELHAGRYPKLSNMYAEALAAGGTTKESLGALLLKWKAWTEYWAYRRAVEFDNLRQTPEFRRDPHAAALEEKDVKASIARVRKVAGEDFEPWAWTPPPKYRAKPRPEPARKVK